MKNKPKFAIGDIVFVGGPMTDPGVIQTIDVSISKKGDKDIFIYRLEFRTSQRNALGFVFGTEDNKNRFLSVYEDKLISEKLAKKMYELCKTESKGTTMPTYIYIDNSRKIIRYDETDLKELIGYEYSATPQGVTNIKLDFATESCVGPGYPPVACKRSHIYNSVLAIAIGFKDIKPIHVGNTERSKIYTK